MAGWLKLALGAFLLLVPFAFVDWAPTFDALLSADLVPLAAAFLVLASNMPLSAFKWQLLLHVQGLRPGLPAALQAYWIGSFFSNYLPSNVSGDVVRLMVLRAEGRRAEVASSILVERLTGLAVLVALAILALGLRPEHFERFGLLPLLWLMVGGLAFAIGLVLTAGERLARRLESLAAGRSGLAHKLMKITARLAAALAAYRRRPGALVVAFALSVPFYAVLIAFQALVLHAVGADLPLLEVALVVPLVQLVGLLPLAPNGLGLVEGAFVLFYVQAGVPAELALAAAILRRAVSFAVSLLGGPLWLVRMRDVPATPPGARTVASPDRDPIPAPDRPGAP